VTCLQHGYNSNTHRTKNNTTNVVIQQNSRKLLMMDILMSETCWAHKKWNKIASDIKLVFYSSTLYLRLLDDVAVYEQIKLDICKTVNLLGRERWCKEWECSYHISQSRIFEDFHLNYTRLVLTLQRTETMSIIKTNWLTQYREIIIVYSENKTKCITTVRKCRVS